MDHVGSTVELTERSIMTTITTITRDPAAVEADFRIPAVDLYRDIHKGIRAELFAITTTAGNIDPADRLDRTALAAHVVSVAAVLESHAHHEDAVIDPVLQAHLPDLASDINDDHERLEATFGRITDLARSVVDSPTGDERRLTQLLHLDLARFTSAYLDHIDLEERVVMQRLEHLLGVEAIAAMHGAIVSSIPPDEMASSLAFMLPAMNVDDRAELLGGIRMAAPPEAFDATLGLARSVLRPGDFTALADRLGVSR
jgi:iron-sulfur cluster repair protein YtfE (RIC family)